MSSEYKVPLTTIVNITPHPGADRLEIAHVYGFQVVAQKDKYKIGDEVIYVPIDSVLSPELETQIFPPDSKIKLTKQRVKQIRIRQFPSQGMLLSTDEVKKFTGIEQLPPLETDLASILKINKYEPPVPQYQQNHGGGSRNKPLTNEAFHTYNGLSNIKWFPTLFATGEQVVIQEKLHGSLCRFGKLPSAVPTVKQLLALLKTFPTGYERLSILKSATMMTKRIVLSKLNMLPAYENCYGSNNVELTNRVGYVGYYGENVYETVINKVNGFDKIKENEIVYGELIGEGVQKNYHYGHKEKHLVIFDVKVKQEDGTFVWLNPEQVETFAKERGFDMVPNLYKGPYDSSVAHQLTKGDSVYCPAQKIREGVVIKSREGYNDINCPSNKKALKWISEEYLDKDNSDFH